MDVMGIFFGLLAVSSVRLALPHPLEGPLEACGQQFTQINLYALYSACAQLRGDGGEARNRQQGGYGCGWLPQVRSLA